ncbi:MAG: 50S ribosomal protein L11 methyltransferase [Prevotella sp.]
MKYIVAEFNILCPSPLLQVARDLVADASAEAGFEAFENTPKGLKGYVQQELLDQSLLDANLADICLEGTTISYTLRDVEDKDWNKQWEETGFEPINIDNKMVVIDAKHPIEPVDTHLIPIYIDAHQAFGTGTHQTTKMVLSTLLNMQLEGRRVLDCGCGTGILGIAASKLGAKEVVAYDIDEWSVDNTLHNAKQNNIDNIDVLYGKASVLSHVSGLFDIVLANINRNILLQDMAVFKDVMASDATLILSGFYEDDVPMLLETASKINLREHLRHTLDNWCCLVLKN